MFVGKLALAGSTVGVLKTPVDPLWNGVHV